jgi:hypothetical protein
MLDAPLKRLETYLNTYKVYPNCIDFRIHSSNILQEWKKNQSFQLKQITDGKFFFSQDKKEVLLLQYDLWSRFLYEIENYIIELMNLYGEKSTDIIKKEDIDNISVLANKTFSVYENVMCTNVNNNFNSYFSEIWLKVHTKTNKLIISQLKSLLGYSYAIFYTMITKFLSKLMHYTLMEIHEINSLINHKNNDINREPPFLIVTPLDETFNKFYKTTLTVERYKEYAHYFDLEKLYFKNYSNSKIESKTFQDIEDAGTEILYRLNF